jgi:hypothetical protein
MFTARKNALFLGLDVQICPSLHYEKVQVDALINAYDDFQNATADLTDETTVQEAATSLQPQIAAVQSAR